MLHRTGTHAVAEDIGESGATQKCAGGLGGVVRCSRASWVFPMVKSRGDSGSRGQVDKFCAHLPEPCRGGFVVAGFGGSLGFAVGEVAAAHLLEIVRGGQVDGCGCALLGGLQERSHERDEQSLDATGVLSSEGCVHHAGMQRIGSDGTGRQPPGQLVGEQDVAELGLAVGP